MRKVFVFLAAAFLLKQLVWLGLIPIWHFPDEEQHFAYTSFWLEKKHFPSSSEFDVSREIDQSSQILGTERDTRGINNFTYHPEYRIPYTKDQVGLWEEEIKQLNTRENRVTMVKREAARYGPIYYWLTAITCQIFSKADLFVRVFSARAVSVLLSLLTVIFIYLISKQIFSSQILQISLIFLVAFQPMFSFVSSGVNSDNLFNLTFTGILYVSLKIFFSPENKFFSKKKIFDWILLLLFLVIGFYTKQQIIISLPIIFSAFLLGLILLKNKKRKKQYLSLIVLLLIVAVSGFKKFGHIPEYDVQAPSQLTESFLEYIFWHLGHTIAETIPWYWGVFNWLGVTLPRWVNQVQARLLMLTSLGILIYFIKVIKEKRFFKRENLKILFLLSAAVIYYFSIISWDFFFRSSQGFSFGIQGRYFFPTIVSHMLIILLGLTSLIPHKFKALFIKLLSLWWLVFSLIGLHTAASAYYQFWPIQVFLNQNSQYKPMVFKSLGFSIIFTLFFTSLIFLLIQLFKLKLTARKK